MQKIQFRKHLDELAKFWSELLDKEYGGFYGYVSNEGVVDKKAVKGGILNSRILWFFSNAYLVKKDKNLLKCAKQAYDFLVNNALDKEYNGVYWSFNYDGSVEDDTKHTYNQAFAIYAHSSYYESSSDGEALELAKKLYYLIEDKCKSETGYLECYQRDYSGLVSNEKLSENGVIAERTMNTLLHVMEAYTQLYAVAPSDDVRESLIFILDLVENKIYNPKLKRQEVFFDAKLNSLIDLYSYGHDIETAWLVDRTLEVIEYKSESIAEITKTLAKQVYDIAYDGTSLANECCEDKVDEARIWWVQAEAMVGFYNEYQKDNSKVEYLEATKSIWRFINKYLVRDNEKVEWYNCVTKEGVKIEGYSLVSMWKCPYHNGRMCIEMISRL